MSLRSKESNNIDDIHNHMSNQLPGGESNKESRATQLEPYTYTDHSRSRPQKLDVVATICGPAFAKDPIFPVKLHRILSSKRFEDVIAWLPHGRAFRILHPKSFEQRVIPLFFRHGKYASFVRQINGWGYRRITSGPDYGAYYHELFLRGMPHLCERIRRPPPGGVRKNKKENNADPPDFYKISAEFPLPNDKFNGASNTKTDAGSSGSTTSSSACDERNGDIIISPDSVLSANHLETAPQEQPGTVVSHVTEGLCAASKKYSCSYPANPIPVQGPSLITPLPLVVASAHTLALQQPTAMLLQTLNQQQHFESASGLLALAALGNVQPTHNISNAAASIASSTAPPPMPLSPAASRAVLCSLLAQNQQQQALIRRIMGFDHHGVVPAHLPR